jgi:hypothetical protein
MKLWFVALVFALSACTKGNTPPPVDNTGGGGTPVAAACTADTDCVVSCAQPEQCCDQLCPPCEQAWLKSDLETHHTWQVNACDPSQCPVAKCMAPTEETFARCEAGACVVGRRPL